MYKVNRFSIIECIIGYFSNDSFLRREVQLGLPSHMFAKFSTVSVIVIYGNKVCDMRRICRTILIERQPRSQGLSSSRTPILLQKTPKGEALDMV